MFQSPAAALGSPVPKQKLSSAQSA
jgi:hypothetical protein